MKNDYLQIKFSNNELYVPVERINLIEKFLGSEGMIPKLSTIGTKEWEKKKQKIQEKLAEDAKAKTKKAADDANNQGKK